MFELWLNRKDEIFLFIMGWVWIIPLIYLNYLSSEFSYKELGKKAIIYYLITAFISLTLSCMFYGIDETFRMLGYKFGELIKQIFFTVISLGLGTGIILLFLMDWSIV